jgi:hypothetical protein
MLTADDSTGPTVVTGASGGRKKHLPKRNQQLYYDMKLSNLFLGLCLTAGIVGATPAGGDLAYGILRPLSAVFFILFFVSRVVEAAEQDHMEHTGPVAVAAVNERRPSELSMGHAAGAH